MLKIFMGPPQEVSPDPGPFGSVVKLVQDRSRVCSVAQIPAFKQVMGLIQVCYGAVWVLVQSFKQMRPF